VKRNLCDGREVILDGDGCHPLKFRDVLLSISCVDVERTVVVVEAASLVSRDCGSNGVLWRSIIVAGADTSLVSRSATLARATATLFYIL
jgi:hypothetical protein